MAEFTLPRIGFLAYAIDRETGGISRYSRELVRAMSRLHPEIYLLSAFRKNYHSIHIPGSGFLPGLLSFGQVEISMNVRLHNLGLVHDPSGICPFFLTRVPRIVTVHDVFPYIPSNASSTAEWIIYHFWLPLILPHVDAVITVSEQSCQDLIQYLSVDPQKVTVIPEAAGSHFHPLGEAEYRTVLERYGIHRPYILSVGSLEPRKNLLRLLKAYVRLGDPQPDLVIVGARNYWKSTPVVETVAQLGLEQHVHFTGYVDDADLPALYSAAELFAFPSLYEGFGLPVLEAMACGTPVVTSNVSSLPEVAGDAALLVDPNDVEALAAAMRRVLDNRELAADLRRRGLDRAAQFSWERTARETLAIYQRVLGKT